MHDPQDIRPSEQIRSLRSTFMDKMTQGSKIFSESTFSSLANGQKILKAFVLAPILQREIIIFALAYKKDLIRCYL